MARTAVRWGILLVALTAALMPHRGAAAEDRERVDALLASAELCTRRGDLEGALEAANRAAALAPDCPEVHATLALLNHQRADIEAATHHYTQFQLLSLQLSGHANDELLREIAEGEATMVFLINSERAARGLPLLRPDLALTAMARAHSEEMRDHGYFGHVSPVAGNRTISDRCRRVFSRPVRAVAENLSRMSGTLWSFTPANIRDSHDRLMRSTRHRANILWTRPTHIGVGIAVNSGGDYWITENFALLDG